MMKPWSNDLLVVEDLDKTFTLHLHGGLRLPVVHGVGFAVRRGECVVLGGPSGVGKSSILKIVFGAYRPDAGRIFLADGDGFLDIAAASPREVIRARRHIMGYVSQFLRVIRASPRSTSSPPRRGRPVLRPRRRAAARFLS